ncbi:uL15 family ribosomal protein [Patescibacteria group bacterium]|nr:uL15 family ribosomal protein [Patescibacteria group bacterium]
MQLHQLQPKTKRIKMARVGRGGKRGKTSGKGMKGQKSRAGNSMRPELRDMIKKLPKLRGHGKNRADTVNNERAIALPVNLTALELAFGAGAEINPRSLESKGLIRIRGGKSPLVKILGTGTLSKKFIVSGCKVSASAKEKILAVGGTVA